MDPHALYDLIKKRRSIRAYDPSRPIDPALLDRIITAGTWAASGKNLQNWRFYVLSGKKRDGYLALSQKSWLSIKDVLEKRLKPSLYKFTERFFYTLGDAPVLVIAFAEIGPEDHLQTQTGNVYLAMQNMVLAAEAEGLGSCLLGSPLEIENDLRDFLGLKKKEEETNLRLVCGMTLGYAAHSPPAPPRRLDRVIFLDQ